MRINEVGKRSLTSAAVLAAATLGVAVAGSGSALAAPGVQATCSSSGSRVITGGFESTLWCPGAEGFVDGYGTTLTDATTEAQALHALYVGTGVDCSGSGTRAISGGYEATLWCPGRNGFVSGQGTTLTDAARAARLNVE